MFPLQSRCTERPTLKGSQDPHPQIDDFIDDLYVDEEDELTMKNGNIVNTSGFKGKGNIGDLNPSAIANGSPPVKDPPKGSLIKTKMLGCLNSRNEKTFPSLEPDLSTIHLHIGDQPELNRGKTK